jgi:hypothetical protein
MSIISQNSPFDMAIVLAPNKSKLSCLKGNNVSLSPDKSDVFEKVWVYNPEFASIDVTLKYKLVPFKHMALVKLGNGEPSGYLLLK